MNTAVDARAKHAATVLELRERRLISAEIVIGRDQIGLRDPDRRLRAALALRIGGPAHRVRQRRERMQPAEFLREHQLRRYGPREVARHQLTTPGRPSIQDAHYPPKPPGALERVPRAQSAAEAAFLQIGPGASAWLTRAAAAGAGRVRRKMAEAVDLSKLHGPEEVEQALRVAADAGRFDEGALAAILAHYQARSAQVIVFPAREASSLQRSTRAWEGFSA